MTLAQILGMIYILVGLIMLWAGFRMTTQYGFKNADERWSLLRRGVYCVIAFALFSIGVKRMHGGVSIAPDEFVYEAMLLAGIMIFPLLRATNLISPNTFMGFHQADHGR